MRPPWLLAATSALAMAAIQWSASARADEAVTASPEAAVHEGRIEGEGVTWESTFLGSNSIDPSAPRERIVLARPVAAELDAARSPGVVAVADAHGAIVALVVDTRSLPGWREAVTVILRASLVRDGEEVVLAPPLARGERLQRLDVSGNDELRFEPAPSAGLVHNVGSYSTPGVTEEARHAFNARLGERHTSLDETPLYLVATSTALDGGLRGRALTMKERARPGMTLAVLMFVALAAASAAAYRWLGRDAGIERAEAVLREEFERHGR